MSAPATTPINIELMLSDHLADECERVRRAVVEHETELVQLRQRLATLEAIGRAAGVPTDYTLAETPTMTPLARIA